MPTQHRATVVGAVGEPGSAPPTSGILLIHPKMTGQLVLTAEAR